MELSWSSWWPRGPWKPILGQLDGESLDSFQGTGAVTTSSGCPPALDAAAGLPWGLSRGRGAILSWSLQLSVPQGQHLCLSAGLARWACVALDAGGSCSVAEPMSWAQGPRALLALPSRGRCGESWGQGPAWGSQPAPPQLGKKCLWAPSFPTLPRPHLLLCLGDLPCGAVPVLGPRVLGTRATCVAGTALPLRLPAHPPCPTVHTRVDMHSRLCSSIHSTETRHMSLNPGPTVGPRVPKIPAGDT